jgi:hypothetical protein
MIEGGENVEKGKKPYASECCQPEGGHFERGWCENRGGKGGYESYTREVGLKERLAR